MLIQHRVLDLHFYRGGDSGQTSCICLCIKRGKAKDNNCKIFSKKLNWRVMLQHCNSRQVNNFPAPPAKMNTQSSWIQNFPNSPTAGTDFIEQRKERSRMLFPFQENDEMISFPYSRLKANILIRVRCISRGDHHHHHQGKITRNVSGWEW